MKFEYIPHDKDLYRFRVDALGVLHSVEVSIGNRQAPYVAVLVDQVPQAVLSKLKNIQPQKTDHDRLREEYLEAYYRNSSETS